MRSTLDSGPINVVIADDHALFRQCVRKLLEEQPDLRVVGEFEDGRGVCDLAEAEQPDLLLLDLEMPRMGGFDVLRQLRVANVSIDTIVLTASQDRVELGLVLELGAKGIVAKKATTDELLKAIRQVHRGYLWFDRAIRGAESPGSRDFAAILEGYLQPAGSRKSSRWESLTPRETEVSLLVSKGLRYREIARRLDMSPSTLNNHLRNIFDKLQIRGRVGLALYGRRHST